MHILAGRGRFTPTSGEPIEFRSGDTLFFPADTKGEWRHPRDAAQGVRRAARALNAGTQAVAFGDEHSQMRNAETARALARAPQEGFRPPASPMSARSARSRTASIGVVVRAGGDQLGHHLAHARADREALAVEAERVVQARASSRSGPSPAASRV